VHSKSDIIQIINKFISLVSNEYPLEKVYLFGSYCIGKFDEYSDIDLAVVSDKFEGSRFWDKKKLNKYILKSSIDLEIHPFKPEDFTPDNPFVNEIISTGEQIL